MPQFLPCCKPLLIGSLPLKNHDEAVELIFSHTPDLPIWPQLPAYREEGMIRQFLPGMPGLQTCDDTIYVDTTSENFDNEVLAFYEEYLLVTEGGADLDESRFSLHQNEARGFFSLLKAAADRRESLTGLKGQTTGPFTFATGLVDDAGRAIFYNDQLRDIAIKHLAMKAKYQTRKMAALADRVLMFFDEPGLAGLGTSAFITISQDDIVNALSEVFQAVTEERGLTGVHVCANTEWPVIFASGVDIVSYDAYGYFDRLILYSEQLRHFFARGGILATGIVPTAPADIQKETVDTLLDKWRAQCEQLEAIGIDHQTVYTQSLITPSCGTGAITLAQAQKVLELTQGLSVRINQLWS
jgi:hypothetical protein